jgi:Domain of unknown function (DUF4349)
MTRLNRKTLSDEAQCDLAVLDAVIAGVDDTRPHESAVGELAVAMREMRPSASEDFISALDARAAQGFARPARGRSRLSFGSERPPGPAPRSRDPRLFGRARALGRRLSLGRARLPLGHASSPLLRPASGLAIAALLAIAVALPIALSGATHNGHRGTGSTLGAPATPAVEQKASGSAQLAPSGSATTKAPSEASSGVRTPEGSTPGVAASAPALVSPVTPAPAGPAGGSTRLVERSAALDVGVGANAVQSSAQRVFTIVSAFGGYVRQSNVSSGEPRRGEEPAPAQGEEAARGGASFDIRVPSANVSSAIAALAHLGHVRSETNTTNDLTDQHTSLRSAFDAAQAERQRIVAKLRKTTSEGEIDALKEQLRSIDGQIASLEHQLRALDQRVTYTSLALTLTPETAAGSGSSSGDLTPGSAADDAAQILDTALAVLVIAAAVLLPLAAVAIAAWVAVALTRRRLREHALDAS